MTTESLWEPIGNSDPLEPHYEAALTEMLTAMVFQRQKSCSMLFESEDGPIVFTVFFLERRDAVVGYVFAAPDTVIFAQFKDWLAEGINEDGTLNGRTTELPFTPIMADAPSEEEQADDFAAKAEEIQDDEAAQAFDAMILAWDINAE